MAENPLQKQADYLNATLNNTQLNRVDGPVNKVPLWELLSRMIAVIQGIIRFVNATTEQQKSSNTNLSNATYLTASQESAILPFSRELIAGTGITFDDSVANERTISSSGSGGMVPFFIASGDTFTVPVNKQALFAVPIDNEGTLVVDGILVWVD